jgi:hypothetical protein
MKGLTAYFSASLISTKSPDAGTLPGTTYPERRSERNEPFQYGRGVANQEGI